MLPMNLNNNSISIYKKNLPNTVSTDRKDKVLQLSWIFFFMNKEKSILKERSTRKRLKVHREYTMST